MGGAEGERGAPTLAPEVAEVDVAAQKLPQPAVVQGPGHAHVVVGPPVHRHRCVGVLIDGPVEAEVGDAPAVARRAAHDVVHAEARCQDAAGASALDALEHEGKPEDGNIGEVELHRPRHQHVAGHDLDLVGVEVVVGMLEIAGGEADVRPVDDLGRHRGQVAAHDPGTARFREPGARAVGGAAPAVEAVDHGGAVEGLALAPGKHRSALGPEQARGVVHRDGGVGLQLHALRTFPEESRTRVRCAVEDHLAARPELQPGSLVLAGLVSRKREQGIEHGVRTGGDRPGSPFRRVGQFPKRVGERRGGQALEQLENLYPRGVHDHGRVGRLWRGDRVRGLLPVRLEGETRHQQRQKHSDHRVREPAARIRQPMAPEGHGRAGVTVGHDPTPPERSPTAGRPQLRSSPPACGRS